MWSQAQSASSPMIIFDFDGTIVDSHKSILDAYNEYVKSHPFWNLREISMDQASLLRHKSSREIMRFVGMNWLKLIVVVPAIRKLVLRRYHRGMIFPGMVNALRSVRNNSLRLGLLTTNHLDVVKRVMGLDQFEEVHTNVHFLRKAKQLKRLASKACKAPDDAYYVCDEERDIIAAKQAGMKTIAVTWGFHHPERLQAHQPDFIVNTPEELDLLFQDIACQHQRLAS